MPRFSWFLVWSLSRWSGWLWSARVRSRFCDYLTLQWPNFALTEPAGDELDGAAMLPTLATDHPLFGRVSYAAR